MFSVFLKEAKVREECGSGDFGQVAEAGVTKRHLKDKLFLLTSLASDWLCTLEKEKKFSSRWAR